jgi:hypothetical protein
MPQLDILSYFAQFIWFTGTFLTFYFWMTHDYLPTLRKAMSIRAAYTQTQDEGSTGAFSEYTQEELSHKTSVNGYIQDLFEVSKNSYQGITTASQVWLTDSRKMVQSTSFKKAHKNFVKAVIYTQQEPQVFEQILLGTSTKGQVPAKVTKKHLA